jgi:hypothetical protein
MESDDMNSLIDAAQTFARDRVTHIYEVVRTSLTIEGRSREVAIELFRPRASAESSPPLALIPGGALTPATNFFALAPQLMAREPGRSFLFLNTPGTGLSGRGVVSKFD